MPIYIVDHVVRVWKSTSGAIGRENLLVTLYWGDDLASTEEQGAYTRVTFDDERVGWVKGVVRTTDQPLLSLAFIDVGQGDACLITTPDGQRVLVDGGENQQAARYVAGRYWADTKAGRDVLFDAVVVTHGDADHFAGLCELVEAVDDGRDRKRIRFATRRVFHNGLAKRPSSVGSDIAFFGPTVPALPGLPLITGLVDDIRLVPDAELNAPFCRWKKALNEMANRHPFTIRRLDSSIPEAFSFLNDVTVEVLSPRTVPAPGGVPSLPFLPAEGGNSPSASRTINGHSITLRISYGKARILLTGDLNEHTEAALTAEHGAGRINLHAHVLKVPHHGSSDVSIPFLHAVKPLVSIVSAGDEDARRDYMHPRANVLGALGNAGHGEDPLIFVTNLAAFDRWAGRAYYAKEDAEGKLSPDLERGSFYARERSSYGIIHVRTDGTHLFVARRGARGDRIEAYCYELGDTPRKIALSKL